jgi:hypothetical protein
VRAATCARSFGEPGRRGTRHSRIHSTFAAWAAFSAWPFTTWRGGALGAQSGEKQRWKDSSRERIGSMSSACAVPANADAAIARVARRMFEQIRFIPTPDPPPRWIHIAKDALRHHF